MDASGLELRQSIGDRFIVGDGFEVGAGLRPSRYRGTHTVTVVDKRDAEALAIHFGSRPPYPVLSLEQVRAAFPAGRDFLVAHHVIEHSPNPIRTMAEWIPLVRDGGVFYLSLPTHTNSCERDRLPTPLDHVLDDFFLDRDADDFESRGHVLSFIAQWTAMSPENFWYAQGSVQSFAAAMLSEARRPGGDLHWHTYTLPTMTELTEAAFYQHGAGLDWLHREETEAEIFLVFARADARRRAPECLAGYRARLLRAAARVASSS